MKFTEQAESFCSSRAKNTEHNILYNPVDSLQVKLNLNISTDHSLDTHAYLHFWLLDRLLPSLAWALGGPLQWSHPQPQISPQPCSLPGPRVPRPAGSSLTNVASHGGLPALLSDTEIQCWAIYSLIHIDMLLLVLVQLSNVGTVKQSLTIA